mgnify:CR=1 FL=1
MDSDDEAEMTPTSKVAASRPQTGPEGTPGTPGSPGAAAPPIPLLMQPVAQRFQVDAFAKAAGKRGLLGRKRADGSVTLPVMAAHQAVDLPLSLLKLSSENTNRAVKNFAMILKYCEGKPLPPADAAALCQPMLKAAVKRPELRDELFLHLVKQSRGNPSEDSLARVWVLMSLLCCTAPPSRELAPFVSAFVQQSVNDPAAPPAVQAAASVAFEGLRNTVKHGARRTTPSPPSDSGFNLVYIIIGGAAGEAGLGGAGGGAEGGAGWIRINAAEALRDKMDTSRKASCSACRVWGLRSTVKWVSWPSWRVAYRGSTPTP